jgi:hypothetical protein
MSQLPGSPTYPNVPVGVPDWDGNGNGIPGEYGDGPDLDGNGIPDEIGINPDSLQPGYPHSTGSSFDPDLGAAYYDLNSAYEEVLLNPQPLPPEPPPDLFEDYFEGF